MKLIIKRITSILYQSDSLLELELDPHSLSGIDYWSQEARSAKVKLLLDDALQSILLGALHEVKAGFHTLSVALYQDNNTRIYTGVIPEAGFTIEYLSLTHKTVEIELIDYLGLILQLASDRIITLTDQYINPVATIPSIIGAIIHPQTFEPDTEAYTNADVLRLMLCIGSLNYQYAHYTYDQNKWLPFNLVNHVLVDSYTLRYVAVGLGILKTTRFGFILDDQDIYLIYWEWQERPGNDSWQHFRFRKYLVTLGNISLVEELDQHNNDNYIDWDMPTPPEVESIIAGIGDYHISNDVAYYSGPASLQSIEVVQGEYSARELLGEFLRISNATLTVDNYSFYIKNRLDVELPAIHLSDPLEAEIDQADESKPSLTPVAIASLAVIDAVCKYYETTLNQYPYQARIKTHQHCPEIKALNLSTPYDLLNLFITFDGYRIMPLEVSWEPETDEIEISGRAQR